MSWKTVNLGDLCSVITKGTTPSNIGASFTDKSIKYIRSEMLTSAKYVTGDFLYISKETHEKLKRSQLNTGDILFSMAGVYLGKTAILRAEDIPSNTNQAVALIRIDPNKCNNEYVYYYLNIPDVVKTANTVQSQSAQPNINLKQIGQLKIQLPDLDTQRRIASILSAYDDLIENNQKQIKLLEEAAQRLYKEWFVDLHFPGYENVKVVDGVPEGWEKKTLEDICCLSKTVLTPTKIPSNCAYIGLEHMPRKSICLCNWGNSDEVNSNKYQYDEDDIIFGKIRPYFHKVGFALNTGIASTDSIIMKSNKELWSLLLMTVSSVDFVDYTSKTCKEGSKMPRADWDQMRIYPVLIPDKSILELFNNNIWNITRKIKTLALQCRSLSEARDRLLPKLMSGEVEV